MAGVGHSHLDQEVVAARDHEQGQGLGAADDEVAEALDDGAGLGLEAHGDEGLDVAVEWLQVDAGVKAGQDLVLVEGADAFQAGGLGDAGGLGEGPVGDPCLLLQFGQEDSVDR